MKKILLSLSCLLFLNSCITKIALKSIGIWDTSATEKHLHNGDKELVFLGMHHIGKQEFYDDVKKKVDSLHKLGFVIFYEKVIPAPGIDSLKKDSLLRKFRKVVGVLQVNGYLNKEDGTFMGKKHSFVKDLVNQPFGKAIGLDSLVDKRVDAYLDKLIEAYELTYKTIELSPCDFTTTLKEKYNCGKLKNKEGHDFLLIDYRNNLIVNAIIESPGKKIALMYGKKHLEGIFSLLKTKDPKWQLE